MSQDPRKRIAQLEGQVQTLQAELRAARQREKQFRAKRRAQAGGGSAAALGFNEDLEARVAGPWLSRLAVLLLMTAVAVTVAAALNIEALTPWQRVIIGFALAALAIAYGAVTQGAPRLFGETVLGCGLAGLPILTFGAFYLPYLQIAPPDAWAYLALAVAVLCYPLAVWWRESGVTAGLALLFVFAFLATAGFTQANENLFPPILFTSGLLTAAVFALSLRYDWRTLVVLGALGHFGIYALHFRPALELPGLTEWPGFMAHAGYLTLGVTAYTLGCAWHKRRNETRGRRMALFTAAVAITGAWLLHEAVAHEPLISLPVFRVAIGGLFAILGVIAAGRNEAAGLTAQTLWLLAAITALWSALETLSGSLLVLVLSVSALVLATFYRIWRWPVLAAAGLVMAVLAAGVALVQAAPGDTLRWAGAVAALYWPAVGFGALCLFIAGVIHDGAPSGMRANRPNQRPLMDQGVLAFCHAGLGSLLLMVGVLLYSREEPVLPFMLAGAAGVNALVGIALLSPVVQACSMLIAAGAFCAFQYFWLTGMPGFVGWTAGLIAAIFACGYLWYRYTPSFTGGDGPGRELIGAAPFLLGAITALQLAAAESAEIATPYAHGVLAIALLGAGHGFRINGLRAAAVLAAAAATAHFMAQVYRGDPPLTAHDGFLGLLAGMLAVYAAGERVSAGIDLLRREAGNDEDLIRTLLVAAAALTGVLALYEWAPPLYVTPWWIALGATHMGLGFVFNESRYRWAGLLILAIAVGRVFAIDLWRLPTLYAALSTAALAVVLLVISSLYSRSWWRALRQESNPRGPVRSRRAKEDAARHG